MRDVPKEAIEHCVIEVIKKEVLLNPIKREKYISQISEHLDSEHPEIPARIR